MKTAEKFGLKIGGSYLRAAQSKNQKLPVNFAKNDVLGGDYSYHVSKHVTFDHEF